MFQYIFRFRLLDRGQKLNPNIFFSNFSGASGISRQNPGISRQKSLIPWASRDIPNFLAPTPSRGRPLPHQKISGLKSLGLGSFFVPDWKRFRRFRFRFRFRESETGRIRFRRARSQTPNSVSFFCPRRASGRELSEFLSAYDFVCQSELAKFFFFFRRTHRVCCRTQ